MNSFRRAPTSTLIDRALGSGVDVLRTGGGLPRNRAELAGLLTDPVAQRMPNTTVANEFMPGQSPILSPKMLQFVDNLNQATGRRNRQTGLLDRYAGRTGGTAGLLGAIGTSRQSMPVLCQFAQYALSIPEYPRVS